MNIKKSIILLIIICICVTAGFFSLTLNKLSLRNLSTSEKLSESSAIDIYGNPLIPSIEKKCKVLVQPLADFGCQDYIDKNKPKFDFLVCGNEIKRRGLTFRCNACSTDYQGSNYLNGYFEYSFNSYEFSCIQNRCHCVGWWMNGNP